MDIQRLRWLIQGASVSTIPLRPLDVAGLSCHAYVDEEAGLKGMAPNPWGARFVPKTCGTWLLFYRDNRGKDVDVPEHQLKTIFSRIV
jgi:hypothetical protein